MGFLDWLFGKSQPNPSYSGQAVGDWKKGDRVLAKWHDSYFYPAHIGQVAGNTCEVFYDDGDVAWVHKAHIQLPDITVGSRVFSRIKGGPGYYPGTVRQQKGEKILVQYDNGEEEWTMIKWVRVQRPIADVGDEEPAPGQLPPGVKPDIDLGDPVDMSTWFVGDRVLARWFDFYWYPATILGIGSKGVQILYDSGSQQILPEKALMPLHVEEGEEIYIRPKKEQFGPQGQFEFLPATVTRVNGEMLDVQFEDGALETNTRASRARFWRCPVLVPDLPFDEGDRVLARDMDECIYPAEIISIAPDRVVVHFLDGPERMLTPEMIREFNLEAGARVECRWKGGPNYFSGVITRKEGDRVYIKYDDGDEEWNSIRLVRLPRPM